ncbi:hypothetical protein H7K45_27740 [Mycobacterium yunnanensis]|uniref:Uncharacterized protein n=1 Tax=Mycobacterium yunnanensis TaxID=368477 RepID=A0A9X2Z733_9MYCO|nr:hypothetical protein [Mycobacterium yunnanensis]MCV7424345.1 hypothetical protein [Mycobacterium yunnanensis]
MTPEERDELAGRLLAEYTRHVDYVRASTVLISLLPTLYGIFTFVWGQAVWSTNTIYRTALDVPGAPQSWGLMFVTLGVSTMVLAAKCKHLAVTVTTVITSVVLASFMVSFLIESWRAASLYGIPPAVVYGIFAVAFLNRSRFAWTSWRAESGWAWPWLRNR